jgi:hypothetical protein
MGKATRTETSDKIKKVVKSVAHGEKSKGVLKSVAQSKAKNSHEKCTVPTEKNPSCHKRKPVPTR